MKAGGKEKKQIGAERKKKKKGTPLGLSGGLHRKLMFLYLCARLAISICFLKWPAQSSRIVRKIKLT